MLSESPSKTFAQSFLQVLLLGYLKKNETNL